jgi:hypothetical protein
VASKGLRTGSSPSTPARADASARGTPLPACSPPAALDDQLPDPFLFPLPPGIEALIVTSQTPVVLPALATSVVLPVSARVKERLKLRPRRNRRQDVSVARSGAGVPAAA